MHTAVLFRLLTWFSPIFPVGAFAYSHGLEQAIADGHVHDAATLRGWIIGLLDHGSFRTDAVLLAAAYRGEAVAELAVALAFGVERLRESIEQGVAFRNAMAIAWPDTPGSAGPAYAPSVGQAAAAHGLPLADVLPAYLHALCANQVSVAVRLVPLGQRAGLAVLAQLEPTVLAAAARAADSTLDDLGSTALAAEIASMRHETLQPRLFIT